DAAAGDAVVAAALVVDLDALAVAGGLREGDDVLAGGGHRQGVLVEAGRERLLQRLDARAHGRRQHRLEALDGAAGGALEHLVAARGGGLRSEERRVGEARSVRWADGVVE